MRSDWNMRAERAPDFLPDAWLSGLLGKAAFHLSTETNLARHVRPAAASGVSWFADAKVQTWNTERLRSLEKVGFQLIDTNLQLSRKGVPLISDLKARFAKEGDARPITEIARSAFRYDRFHADPAIANATANEIKACWASNYFKGLRGEWMVVAELEDNVAGFLQLLRGADGALVIDLIAVDERQRGRGLARSMISWASQHCLPHANLRVGTQISNVPSIRLYEGMGFHTESANYVLHQHGC